VPKLTVAGFDGIYPRKSETALPSNAAAVAQNVKLYAGELRKWRGPTLAFNPSNGGPVYTIFRIYNDSLAQSTWLTWAGNIDATLGPIADTSEIRVYFTGAGSPRKTNWVMASDGSAPYPTKYLEMGVPAPTTPPTVGITAGGSTAAETRAYVYTYISTFGSVKEESAPSPASALITMSTAQACNVSAFAVAPTTAQKYNITGIRIYRTFAGGSGATGYAYVDEIAVAPSTGVVVSSGTSTGGVTYSGSAYVDNLTATQLGEQIATATWSAPPSDMTGLVAMANGILAGFVGNTVHFSEPYFPHAWPQAYSLTVPDNIVGLGAFGSTLVVCTEKYPYIISGNTPESMSQERLPLPEPCVAKKSIVSDQFGVTYASPNGLVQIGSGSRGIVTSKLFLRDEFQQYAPSTLMGAVYDNKYFGFFNSTPQGRNAFALSKEDIPAMSILTTAAQAVHVDTRTGTLFYVNPTDNKVYSFDSDEAAPQTYTWRSKRFLVDHGATMSALKVDGDFSGGQTVSVKIFGDNGELKTTLTVASFDPVRIPPFRAREVQVELVGTMNVRSVMLATSVPELRG
jgi:hypothetical protein